MIEIRWHARAGQGAKTAAHLFALATLREGTQRAGLPGVRGRGAEGRALRPRVHPHRRPADRRHDSVTKPGTPVVVLDSSLWLTRPIAEA